MFRSRLTEMTEGTSHPSSHPWPLSMQHLSIVNDWLMNPSIFREMNIRNFHDPAICPVEMTPDFRWQEVQYYYKVNL